MSFFISDAMATAAQQAAPAAGGSAISSILMLAGFILIFYFLLWRPQSKRAKEHKDLINQIAKGDEVITAGGITGKVSEVKDDFIKLTIAEGVTIKIQKQAVTSCLPKGSLDSIG